MQKISKKALKDLVDNGDEDSGEQEGILKHDLLEISQDVLDDLNEDKTYLSRAELNKLIEKLQKSDVALAKGTKLTNDGNGYWSDENVTVEMDDEWGDDNLENIKQQGGDQFVVIDKTTGQYYVPKGPLQTEMHVLPAKEALRIVKYRNGDQLPYKDINGQLQLVESQLEAYQLDENDLV